MPKQLNPEMLEALHNFIQVNTTGKPSRPFSLRLSSTSKLNVYHCESVIFSWHVSLLRHQSRWCLSLPASPPVSLVSLLVCTVVWAIGATRYACLSMTAWVYVAGVLYSYMCLGAYCTDLSCLQASGRSARNMTRTYRTSSMTRIATVYHRCVPFSFSPIVSASVCLISEYSPSTWSTVTELCCLWLVSSLYVVCVTLHMGKVFCTEGAKPISEPFLRTVEMLLQVPRTKLSMLVDEYMPGARSSPLGFP